MITRKDLLDKLINGAVWNTGVTFERTNPVPIEKYSIFESLLAAQEYAQNNPVAYPGQTLAVITEEGVVTLYIITADKSTPEKSLQEVGSKTLGDDASITLAEDGTLSLYGFKEAVDGYLPQKSNGKIRWIAISEIVKGDGNTVTNGDAKSIDTAGDDKELTATLHGFGAATTNYIPYKDVDGTLKWDAITEDKLDTVLAKKINDKADTATVNVELEKKAVKEEVNTALGLKADKTYVDDQLDLKATTEALKATDDKAEQNKTDIATANGKITAVEGKVEVIEGAYIKSVEYVSSTGLFTFTLQDDTTKEVDLAIEKVVTNFEYSAQDKALVLTLADGSTQKVPLADFIKDYTAAQAAKEVQVAISTEKEISATLVQSVKDDIAKGVDAQTRVAAVEGEVDTLNAKPSFGITSEQISNWDKEVGALAQANTNKKGLADLKAVVEDEKTGLATKASTAELNTVKATAEAAQTEDEVNALIGAAEIAQSQVTGLDTTLSGKEDAGKAQELINDLTGVITGTPAADSTITALAQANGKVTATVSKIAIAQDQVTGLPEALNQKVDVVEGSRLMTDAEGIQLADLVKLKPAEAGAQVNKIEAIKINGLALDIAEDKSITLPKAMADSFGLVKGNIAENGIEINEGLMTVHSLNVNKLTQTIGDELILNGGGSTN